MADSQNKMVLVGLAGFSLFCTGSITLSQIFLAIALIGIGLNIKSGTLAVKSSPFEPAFLFFAVTAVFSVSNAVDVGKGIVELKKFLILIPFWIPYWVSLNRTLQKQVLGCILLSGSFVSFVQMSQTLGQMGLSVSHGEGFFGLSLTFGESQMLCLVVALSWLLAGEEDSRIRFGLYGAVFFLGFGIFSSLARGLWIGLFMGILFLFRAKWKIVLSTGLVIFGIIMIVFFSSDYYRTKFYLKRETDSMRLQMWQTGAVFLAEKPVFGVGMNNIKSFYFAKATEEERKKGWIYGHLHNHFMQYLVMTGLLGFLAMCWWLVETGKFCLSMGNYMTDPWQMALAKNSFALFLAFWGSGLTEYVYGDEEVAMLFFFLLGVFASPFSPISKTTKDPELPLQPAIN